MNYTTKTAILLLLALVTFSQLTSAQEDIFKTYNSDEIEVLIYNEENGLDGLYPWSQKQDFYFCPGCYRFFGPGCGAYFQFIHHGPCPFIDDLHDGFCDTRIENPGCPGSHISGNSDPQQELMAESSTQELATLLPIILLPEEESGNDKLVASTTPDSPEGGAPTPHLDYIGDIKLTIYPGFWDDPDTTDDDGGCTRPGWKV